MIYMTAKYLLTILAASAFLTMTAIADDTYFTLPFPTHVSATEQDCEKCIKALNTGDTVTWAQMQTDGRVATLPAGTLVIVKSVGANGVDTIRLKGYPNDLFATSLLGFKVPLAPR
jgi:hypothetical protein